MKRWIIGLGLLGIAATAALAQEGPRGSVPGDVRGAADSGRFERGRRPGSSPEDRAAYLDARVAALHAGLKLTPEQEKLWPPVEDAIRGLAKQRTDARNQRRERFAALQAPDARPNMPEMLRAMADRQTASGEALRKVADAATPLYAALDPAQKGRLAVLGRGLVGGGHRPGMQGAGGAGPHRPWMR